MPGQFCKIDRHIGSKEKIDRVAGRIARIGHDLRDLLAFGNKSFCKEEACSEFVVMPRSAHGDADGTCLDLDFERLFGGDGVVGFLLSAAGPVKYAAVFGIWCVFCNLATHVQDGIKGRIKAKSKSGKDQGMRNVECPNRGRGASGP